MGEPCFKTDNIWNLFHFWRQLSRLHVVINGDELGLLMHRNRKGFDSQLKNNNINSNPIAFAFQNVDLFSTQKFQIVQNDICSENIANQG